MLLALITLMASPVSGRILCSVIRIYSQPVATSQQEETRKRVPIIVLEK